MTQGDVHIYAFDKPEPLYMEHKNFRDVLLGKGGEIVTLEEGSRTVQIAEAIIKSYQTRETIKL